MNRRVQVLGTLALLGFLNQPVLGGAAVTDSGSKLALPTGAKAAWLIQPGKALPSGTRFDLDRQGNVWLLPVPNLLTRVDGAGVAMREPVRDLVFVNGVLSLVSDIAAGGLQVLKREHVRSGSVRRQLLLPGPGWRLADGGAAGAVAYGVDQDSGQSWLLRLKDRRKLLALPERILAVLGRPDGWYLSTPGGLLKVTSAGTVTHLGRVPGGASSLAWVDKAGLVAAGPQGAALVSGGKAWPFLLTPNPRVRARGANLYVLVPFNGAVLKITGLHAPASVDKE